MAVWLSVTVTACAETHLLLTTVDSAVPQTVLFTKRRMRADQAASAEAKEQARLEKLRLLDMVYRMADADGDGGLTLTEFLATVRQARGTKLARDLRGQLQMCVVCGW